jgi:hypothetical protein
MLVSTAGKAERSLPIRPRFGEATLCGKRNFQIGAATIK